MCNQQMLTKMGLAIASGKKENSRWKALEKDIFYYFLEESIWKNHLYAPDIGTSETKTVRNTRGNGLIGLIEVIDRSVIKIDKLSLFM